MPGAITTCPMSAGPRGRPPLAGCAPFAVVLAVSAALLGFDLGGRVLATNDEARFPMMARDIVSNGHWLLPEISGVPMLNKPPLHAWLIALGAARHDALVRHRDRHGRLRGGRARWPPWRVARFLRACGARVLGEGARRADAARRRGRLPAGGLRLAGSGALASRDGHRDSRDGGRALVGAGSPCRTRSVRTRRGAGRYDARLQSAARAGLEPRHRTPRRRSDDPPSVVPLAPVRRALGCSALEDARRGGRAVGPHLVDHLLRRRRRIVSPAMALLPAALCARLVTYRRLAVVLSRVAPDGDVRCRLGSGRQHLDGRRDIRQRP